jgi:hypothetical protein
MSRARPRSSQAIERGAGAGEPCSAGRPRRVQGAYTAKIDSCLNTAASISGSDTVWGECYTDRGQTEARPSQTHGDVVGGCV